MPFPTNAEAIAGLNAAVNSLLPPVGSVARRWCSVFPLKITPSGIGGFTGISASPEGEIFSCIIEARARIDFEADTQDALYSAVGETVSAVGSKGAVELRKTGILKLLLSAPTEAVVTFGTTVRARQSIEYQLVYEYQKLPETGEGIISSVPLTLDLSDAISVPPRLLSLSFTTDPMPLFTIVDDSAATAQAPSQWTYNGTKLRVEQLKRIRGADTGVNPVKPGTILLYTPAEQLVAANFDYTVDLQSDDENGIGVVWRYQNADNFYFFLMHNKKHYRLLGKKSNGLWAALSAPAVDSVNGYEKATLYRLSIRVQGQLMQARLDDTLILSGSDGSIGGAGKFGFFSVGNNKSFFHSMEVTLL